MALGRRFQRTGKADDIDHAIKAADMALKATREGDPSRPIRLNNLGVLLDQRFDRTSRESDLDRSIKAAEMAVNSTPAGDPHRARRLNNLGTKFARRFEPISAKSELFGRPLALNDLDCATEMIRMGVEATPMDHPCRAMHLFNLGNHLIERFHHTRRLNDRQDSI